jgi:putative flippase GtrA
VARALDVAGARRGTAGVATRLCRFHLLNGIVSLAGNLVLMRALVGELHMEAVAANAIAVLACSTVNFVGAELLIWNGAPGLKTGPAHDSRRRL